MRVGMDGTKLHYATLRYEVSSTEIRPTQKEDVLDLFRRMYEPAR